MVVVVVVEVEVVVSILQPFGSLGLICIVGLNQWGLSVFSIVDNLL